VGGSVLFNFLYLSSLYNKKTNKAGQFQYHGSHQSCWAENDFREHHLFYEYFHGDTGLGLGASHQTGWTALIANLLLEMDE
jgi:hypothetical protein